MKTSFRIPRRKISAVRLLETIVLVVAFILFSFAFVVGFEAEDKPLIEPASIEPETVLEPLEPQDKDYSRFTHSNQFHSRLPCLLCHRRDDNSARIKFPGKADHLPCAGCHALQFSDSSSPICTICHTNAQSGAMKSFPGLRSFGARFDHSRHARVNCATCHKPQTRGVAQSIPSGRSAHITCFQCHTSNSSFSMSSCSVCHTPGRLVRTAETSRAFRIGFSHAKHTSDRSINCATCHTLRRGVGRGKQMSAPLVSMHFAPERSQSCASCHNSKRAFGTEDFANCRRCHQANTFRF
jgi:c(7)-type cytochrome triheme protein